MADTHRGNPLNPAPDRPMYAEATNFPTLVKSEPSVSTSFKCNIGEMAMDVYHVAAILPAGVPIYDVFC